MRWYYVDSDLKQHGPVKEAELIRLFRSKEISSETYVWNGKNIKEWKKISSIEGLEEHFSKTKYGRSTKCSQRKIHQPPKRSLSWCNSTRNLSRSRNGNDYQVGDKIKVYDTEDKLRKAIVISSADSKIKIHYLGYADRWDEWLPSNSRRIKEWLSSPRKISLSEVTEMKGKKIGAKRNSLPSRRKGSFTNIPSAAHALSGRSRSYSCLSRHEVKSFSTQKDSAANTMSGRSRSYSCLSPHKVVSFSFDKDPAANMGRSLSYNSSSLHKVESFFTDEDNHEVSKNKLSIMKRDGEKQALIEKENDIGVSSEQQIRHQKTLLKDGGFDKAKLLNDLAEVQMENLRLKSEFDAQGIKIQSLSDELSRKKLNQEREIVSTEKQAQDVDHENMLSRREFKVTFSESEISVEQYQDEMCKHERSNLKRLKNDIASFEKTIKNQENVLLTSVCQALSAVHKDPQVLQSVLKLKDYLSAEHDKIKKDWEILTVGLNKVVTVKSQFLEATQQLKIENEQIRRENKENKVELKETKLELEKTQLELKREQEKITDERRLITSNKVKMRTVVEEKITQFKKELNLARQKLEMERDLIITKQKEVSTLQQTLDDKEKRLDENIRKVQQEREELMKIGGTTCSERNESSSRELELMDQISQLQAKVNELKISVQDINGELASERERIVEFEKDLSTEKNKRMLLQRELCECKTTLQELREQVLKHKIQKEVWESMNDRVRGNRDKLLFDMQKLQEERASMQEELDLFRSKFEDQSMMEERFKIEDKRNTKDVPMMDQRSSSSLSETTTSEAILDPPSFPDLQKVHNFENIIQSLMSDRELLRKQEEEVKNRITKLEEEDVNVNDFVGSSKNVGTSDDTESFVRELKRWT